MSHLDDLDVDTVPTAQHWTVKRYGETRSFQISRSFLLILSVFLLGPHSYCELLGDGPYEAFYQSGQLKERGTYKDGRRDGLNEQFYEGGQLKSRGNFDNGNGLVKWFDKDGQWLSTEKWTEGENGERRLDEFDENEQLIQRTYLKDSQPLRTDWFDEDGNLSETEFY